MNNEIAQSIANTIRQQLVGLGRVQMMCWGVNSMKYGITEKSETNKYEQAFLQFKVQGFKLKGSVRIILDEGSDTYIIQFFKKGENEAYKTIENVYFDDMVDLIDCEVETDDAKSADYAEKVRKATYNL